MKALRMQVSEKHRESQMSPLSLMFSALLLLVIVGISALAWWLVGASRDREQEAGAAGNPM
jgi:cytoskeletal protein RodZ